MTEATRRRVLYILSPGHSGSTLLTLLLATHPDVATVGERRIVMSSPTNRKIPLATCSCGREVRDCAFISSACDAGRQTLPWYLRDVNYPDFKLVSNPLGRRILFRLTRMTKYGHRGGMLSRWMSAPFRHVCRANAALIDYVLAAFGAEMFLDASKSTFQFEYLKASGLFDITPIHLSRDGRGQFHSMLTRRPSMPEEEAAAESVLWYDRIKAVLDRWEGRVIRVRYEDICERPLEEMRRVANEAGLDPDGISLRFREHTRHTIGNRGVVRAHSEEIVNQELWKTALTAKQLELFERIAGEANRSLGYTG